MNTPCGSCGAAREPGLFYCSVCGDETAAAGVEPPTRLRGPIEPVEQPAPEHAARPDRAAVHEDRTWVTVPEQFVDAPTGSAPAPRPTPARPRLPLALNVMLAAVLAAGLAVGVVYVARTAGSAITTTAPVTSADLLTAQDTRDRSAVESVVGYWIPQVASKRSGTVADGITYDESSIWKEVEQLKSTYPQAALLRSDDYNSFRLGGFWVTIIIQPYTTAQEANRWCVSAGRDPDHCFAKRLSHSEGPQGNTLPR